MVAEIFRIALYNMYNNYQDNDRKVSNSISDSTDKQYFIENVKTSCFGCYGNQMKYYWYYYFKEDVLLLRKKLHFQR